MDMQSTSVLVRKLSTLGPLTDGERALLETFPIHVREIGRDRDLVREGERASHCILLLEGFACRYRTLADGRRQIVSFHIPGDFMDLQGYVLQRLDHSIAALTASKIAVIPYAVIAEMIEHPNLTRLLWRDTVIDGAIHREWIVNLGRRTAYQRIAHVLCELVTRLEAIGLATGGACDLPLTQSELADATGLSTVHVNRVIQELRRDGLIELRGRTFTALKWDELKSAAEFDPFYLQINAGGRGQAT